MKNPKFSKMSSAELEAYHPCTPEECEAFSKEPEIVRF
jgi:hypothetical protein